MIEQLGELAGSDHARLVDDEDRTAVAGQALLPALAKVLKQRSDAGGLDPGAVLKLSRSAPCESRAHHAVALALPRFTCGVEGERLARSSLADDDGDAGPRGR